MPLLAAPACGGGGYAASGGQAHALAIPRPVAASLAARADAIAADLDAGNGCAARETAARLRTAVDRAVADGRIPSRLRATLQSAVTSLSGRIVCTPPPAPSPAPKPKPAPKPHALAIPRPRAAGSRAHAPALPRLRTRRRRRLQQRAGE